MLILGIETSCDETAAALVRDGVNLISQTVASSQNLHVKTGGIVPEVASREQVRAMIPVLRETLKAIKNPSQEIDAIAVTNGPGLIGSLLIGVETAKVLAFAWNKPLITVNHLVGHVYGNFISAPDLVKKEVFPSVVLVVSGGHSDLILLKSHGDWVWLGGTLDDAAGEAFDKAARLLGLGYPGGPAVSKASELLDNSSVRQFDNFKLPRPLIKEPNFDFSFSGLKTALSKLVKDNSPLSPETSAALAYEFQEAVVESLVTKTIKAVKSFDAKSIMLAGGVSANKRLREYCVKSAGNIPVYYPDFEFCADNAAMVASAAFFNQNVVLWEKVEPDASLGLRPTRGRAAARPYDVDQFVP